LSGFLPVLVGACHTKIGSPSLAKCLEYVSQLTIGEKLRKAVSCYVKPAIAGTLIGSAMLNAFAFATGADGVAMQPSGSDGRRDPCARLRADESERGDMDRLQQSRVTAALTSDAHLRPSSSFEILLHCLPGLC
jgi:hypothetical protein